MVPFRLRIVIGSVVGFLLSTVAWIATKCPVLPVSAIMVCLDVGGLIVVVLSMLLVVEAVCMLLKSFLLSISSRRSYDEGTLGFADMIMFDPPMRFSAVASSW